jgi:hypothetical protein
MNPNARELTRQEKLNLTTNCGPPLMGDMVIKSATSDNNPLTLGGSKILSVSMEKNLKELNSLSHANAQIWTSSVMLGTPAQKMVAASMTEAPLLTPPYPTKN